VLAAHLRRVPRRAALRSGRVRAAPGRAVGDHEPRRAIPRDPLRRRRARPLVPCRRRVGRGAHARNGGGALSAAGVEERLRGAGLTEAEARRKRQLFADVEAALETAAAGVSRAGRWFVPGRVEVLGEHTDYAGGRSLLCTVGRGFCAAAAARSDRLVRVADVAKGVTAEAALD